MLNSEVVDEFRSLKSAGKLALPMPGAGHTSARLSSLAEFGRRNLSLARLIEAHTDAAAILTESGRESSEVQWYGVWASDGPQSRLAATAISAEEYELRGLKQYCTGAPLVTTALVTAHDGKDLLLFEVDMRLAGIRLEPSTWKSEAFDVTCTVPVAFDRVRVPRAALVGDRDWYLQRSGFWHGALGPAACWAGGACALAEAAESLGKTDPFGLAHRGALLSSQWALKAILEAAGEQIDASPQESSRDARRRALMVRHLVERHCTDVLDRFGRATGPQLLAFDAALLRQHQELALYIRQCHGEKDLAAISCD